MEKLTFPMRVAAAVRLAFAGTLPAAIVGAATLDDDDPDASEYRRLTGKKRDLSPLTFDRQRELAYYLYHRNPIASRMISAPVEFCTGDQFAVKAKIIRRLDDDTTEDTKRPDAQRVWDEFARRERFYQDLPTFLTDALLAGELVLPVSVRSDRRKDGTIAGDGRVSIGFADPAGIKSVVVDQMDVRKALELKFMDGTGLEFGKRVVQLDSDPNSPTEGRMVGEVLYWRGRRVSNQTRGHSILIDALDWLDALDQFFFDALQGMQARNRFFWSVMMKGVGLEKLKQLQKDFDVPDNGAARLHNENVEYKAVSPSLGSMEVDRALTTVQTFVVGAKGYPMTWFGTGEDANRASASAMSVPTMQMLRAIQKQIREMVRMIARYVVDQAVIAKAVRLADNEEIEIEVQMYDFERTDASVLGSAFQQFVTSLQVATENGWVSPGTAKRVIDSMIQRMGVEVPADETVEKLTAEAEERKAKRREDMAESMYSDVDFPPQKGNGQGGDDGAQE